MRLARRNVMPNKRSLACVGFICWLVCISVAGPATAQDINAIGQLIASGNYAAALAEAQKFEAAAKAQLGANHPSYAYALSALASVYLAQEKYDEAEGLFRRALVIREKVFGDDTSRRGPDPDPSVGAVFAAIQVWGGGGAVKACAADPAKGPG